MERWRLVGNTRASRHVRPVPEDASHVRQTEHHGMHGVQEHDSYMLRETR